MYCVQCLLVMLWVKLYHLWLLSQSISILQLILLGNDLPVSFVLTVSIISCLIVKLNISTSFQNWKSSGIAGPLARGHQIVITEQKAILDTICTAITTGHGGLFFIDGPTDGGKIFLAAQLGLSIHRSHSQLHLLAIASILLHYGQSSHWRLHIPNNIQSEGVLSLLKADQLISQFDYLGWGFLSASLLFSSSLCNAIWITFEVRFNEKRLWSEVCSCSPWTT